MNKTFIAIAAGRALASSGAWAQDFPVTTQTPAAYCLGRGPPGAPLNSSCIDWIQQYYDMAQLYWREASSRVREKCIGQAGHLDDPMRVYITLEACLETWTMEENSKRPHTFHPDPPCDGPGSPRDNRGQCEDDQ